MMHENEFLVYDPESGKLFWKDRLGEVGTTGRIGNWTSQFAGKEAGHRSRDGYLMVGIRQKVRGAHRVIWEMVHGSIPYGMRIDHINGNGLDNRLCNLRLTTCGQNRSNSKHSSKSGLKGVYIERGKYRVQLRVNKKCLSIGLYASKGEAALAYAKASLRHQGKYSVFYRKVAIETNAQG